MTAPVLPYNGSLLDRAGGRRANPDWLAAVAADPAARSVLLWRDACLVDGAGPVRRPLTGDLGGEQVLLGLDGGTGIFATDLSALDEPAALAHAGATRAVDVRRLFPTLDRATAALLAHARGVLHWHRNQRFCGTCGSATTSRDGGHARTCIGCGRLLFPRIEPAVIALVEAPGPPRRCLLARHRGAAEGAFSTLAGFVELGEGLEDAVRREIAEEAGVRVGAVSYQASQTWPFPAGLMIGFRAAALTDVIDVDGDELEEAHWFTPHEVRRMLAEHRAAGTSRVDSIEHFLLGSWLADS